MEGVPKYDPQKESPPPQVEPKALDELFSASGVDLSSLEFVDGLLRSADWEGLNQVERGLDLTDGGSGVPCALEEPTASRVVPVGGEAEAEVLITAAWIRRNARP